VIDIYRKWKIWIELPCDFYREKYVAFYREETHVTVFCVREETYARAAMIC